MAGSLQVLIFMPGISSPAYQDWINGGSVQGQWQVDGGPVQNGGATVSGLSAGAHVVSFILVAGIPTLTPSNLTVNVTDGNTTITAGTYSPPICSSLLESPTCALVETPTHALDTFAPQPLFFAASSMNASFSAFGPANPNQLQPISGQAYIAKPILELAFGESYDIILEGGEVGSDFSTQEELDAIAALVEPFLTSAGMALPGGVPIRCGYMLEIRKVDSWKIARGKGFSLQPAIDGGYIAGDIPAINILWETLDVTEHPPDSQTVAGFAVAFNGITWPTGSSNTPPTVNATNPGFNPNNPNQGPIVGMQPSPPTGHILGYPSTGGANISQPTPIAGAVSVHTVNEDDTINAAIVYGTVAICPFGIVLIPDGHGGFIPTPGGGLPEFLSGNPPQNTLSPYDWYNPTMETSPNTGESSFNGEMPPAYYDGSPNYQWLYIVPTGLGAPPPFWALGWGTYAGQQEAPNPQVNTMPLVMCFWLGKRAASVPQYVYGFPSSTQGAATSPNPPTFSPNPVTPPDAIAPPDRNVRITETTNSTVSPFTISITDDTADFALFNLQ